MEPAQPDLPERAAELLAPGRQKAAAGDRAARDRVGADALELPPVGEVGDEQEAAVAVPLHLADRFVEVADEGPYAGEPTRFVDLRQHDHRAVPRHPGVVPGDPGRPPPVVGDLGAGDEPVPVVGEFTDRRPVVGRRPVERHGGDDAPYIGGRGPGELLQHAPDLARRPVFRAHLRVHPAQPAADIPDGGERPRLVGPVGGVGVQPLIGEVNEHHEEFAVLAHGARPGLPAVLDHPAAGVPGCGQHRGDGAVGAAAHQGAPARPRRDAARSTTPRPRRCRGGRGGRRARRRVPRRPATARFRTELLARCSRRSPRGTDRSAVGQAVRR